jgi:hypothetical protein
MEAQHFDLSADELKSTQIIGDVAEFADYLGIAEIADSRINAATMVPKS